MKIKELPSLGTQLQQKLGLAVSPSDDEYRSNLDVNEARGVAADATEEKDGEPQADEQLPQENTCSPTAARMHQAAGAVESLNSGVKQQLNVLAYENMLRDQSFAKLQGIMGHSVNLRTIPVVCGSA